MMSMPVAVKDLVPLGQTVIWLFALTLFLVWNRRVLGRVAIALANRVEQGAPIKAGGMEIGSAPSLPAVPDKEVDPRHVDKLPHDVYIVHSARRDPGLDKTGSQYYRLRIFMDAETGELLQTIAEVTYRLHPTFRDPIRRVTDPSANFELRTAAWGEFNMTAEILFKNGQRLVVERYINLPGSGG